MLPTLASITDQLTTAIGHQETQGGVLGVGSSLNNPGGLKFAPWESQYGATATPSGFASFPDLSAGFAALKDRVSQLVNDGKSISSLINTFAPVKDGNTNNPSRIQDIASKTGLDPNAPIKSQVSGATDSGDSSEGSDSSGSLWSLFDVSVGSFVAFLFGTILVIIGLLSLKQSQELIIKPLISGAKDGAKKALKAGLTP